MNMLARTRVVSTFRNPYSRTVFEHFTWPCIKWGRLQQNVRPSSSCFKIGTSFDALMKTINRSQFPWQGARLCSERSRNLFTGQQFRAGRSNKLPFEVDSKVAKDTLLYQHTNERFFRMLSIFGLAQLVFWGQLAVFSYTSLGAIDTEDSQIGIQKDTFWGKIIMIQTQYKKRIAGLCLCIGTLVLFFTFIYPRRTIRQLMLLKGGQNLQVTTYTHFGKTKSFTVPVNHLNVLAARASKASQVSFKLKGHRFYYLMDKADGKFHDTKLFDQAVGIKRSI